jgi:glycosyltransferase involved in cell wall biosynthesis
MIQFPQRLHPIHKFRRNDEIYVADLETGHTVPINEIIEEVLEHCVHLSTDQIIEELAARYNRFEVLENLNFLSKLADMGLLFSPVAHQEDRTPTSDRLKIFVTPSFSEQRNTMSFSLNAANHRLLTTLVNHAEVYLGFPEVDENQEEIEKGFDVDGIKPVFFPNWNRTDSIIKFIPKDCDGILSLSPMSLREQIFLKSLSIPFFVRICNETLATDQGINRTLEKYTALREYDALFCDASWTAPFFSQLVSDTQMNGFHCVPYGVDASTFRPMDKANAKRQLAQAVGNPKIVDKLLVGVVPGLNVRNATALLRQLSAANPDVHWLVIHPSLEQYFRGISETVSFFSIRDFQDKEASPFVFNALDMAIFPAILGVSSTYLLEFAACGIPLIVWGYKEPSEVAGACRFFQVEPSPFDSLRPPIASISEGIQELMENSGERKKLGMAAREVAVAYTWDATVRQLLNCISDCQKRRRVNHTPPSPVSFTKYYNRARGTLEFQARDLLDGSPIYEIEKAVAMTLWNRHTPKEIETLLLHLCQDVERVKRIMAEVRET